MVSATNQKHIFICENLHTYDATVCLSSWGISFMQPNGLSVSNVLYWVWNSHCMRMFCMSNRVLRNNNLSGAIPGNLGSSAGFRGPNATGDMYVSDHIRLQFSQEIWFSWVIHKLLWPSKLIRHYLDILVFKTWFEDIGLCHVRGCVLMLLTWWISVVRHCPGFSITDSWWPFTSLAEIYNTISFQATPVI